MMKFRSYRFPTRFQVTLRTTDGPRSVHLTDVNNEGAQIVGAEGLCRGDKVSIEFLNDRTEATVQWSQFARSGIKFRTALTDKKVDILRQMTVATRSYGHSTVGFRLGAMR